MKLADFIIPDAIELKLKSTQKTDAIRELVTLLKNTGFISSADTIAEIILEREGLGTTGIGEGVAIPHCKSDAVDRLVVALGRSEKGIDFESIDKQPANLIFLFIAPVSSDNRHLMALARASRLLKNKDFRSNLMKAKDKTEVLDLLSQF
jgi:fructose-specific phosphotransferase system IIA component